MRACPECGRRSWAKVWKNIESYNWVEEDKDKNLVINEEDDFNFEIAKAEYECGSCGYEADGFTDDEFLKWIAEENE